MAIMITDECINCGACEPECPNTAIYEGGVQWNYSGGTKLNEIELEDGSTMDAKILKSLYQTSFTILLRTNVPSVWDFMRNLNAQRFVP